jgi:hypothetical protein
MKKVLNKLAFVSAFAVIAASCVKGGTEDNFDINYDEKTVMINYAVDNPLAVLVVEPPATGNLSLDLGSVSVSMPGENKSAITVKLVQNNTLLANYNTSNFTNLIPFPANAISIPSEVVIPAGSKQAAIVAVVDPALIDLSKSYAIGLSIASITGVNGVQINSLYKDCLYSVIVKNKYDGKYKLSGYHNRPPSATTTYSYPYTDVDMQMHTTGSSSVRFFFDAAGNYGHPIGIGPGNQLSWYGTAIGPNLTMNPTTNAIVGANNLGGATVIDLDPSVSTHRVTINPTTNKPDKIYVTFRYLMNQDRRFFDTLTYVGPR